LHAFFTTKRVTVAHAARLQTIARVRRAKRTLLRKRNAVVSAQVLA
jgi:hypothetical protein